MVPLENSANDNMATAPIVSLEMIEDVLRDEVFALVDPLRKADDLNSGTEVSKVVNEAETVLRAYKNCLTVLAKARARAARSGAKKFKTPCGMLSLSELAAEAEKLRGANEFWTNALFSQPAETVADFRLKMLTAIGSLTPNSLDLERNAGIAQQPLPAAFMVLVTLCDVIRLFVAKGENSPAPTRPSGTTH